MENVIHKHMFNFFKDHEVLTRLQSGFVPGDSTANQLVDIYNTFCKALDDGKEVRAVFCDISKAFDRVWHKGLLFKLFFHLFITFCTKIYITTSYTVYQHINKYSFIFPMCEYKPFYIKLFKGKRREERKQ